MALWLFTTALLALWAEDITNDISHGWKYGTTRGNRSKKTTLVSPLYFAADIRL